MSGAIGTRYEGPGQGSQKGGRQGTSRTLSYGPSHGMPPTGHRGTQETTQKFRSKRPGPERIPTARIHPCQPCMMPTTTHFIPGGPFGNTHYVLIRVTGGSTVHKTTQERRPPLLRAHARRHCTGTRPMASDAARIRRSNRFRWSPQPHAVTADTKRSASGCTSAAATKALLGAVCFNPNLCVCVVVSASVHAASSPIPATSRCAPSCMQANNDDDG